jgi:hypothetical protein
MAVVVAKAAFNTKSLFTRKLDLNLRKKQAKYYNWCTEICGAENWTLRKADQKYMNRFEMWCWRRIERIRWTEHVRN